MANTTIQGNPQALIESVARAFPAGSQEDARNLLTLMVTNLTVLSPGGNLLQPGGATAGSSAPPTGVTFSVGGGSGVFTASIAEPSTAKPGTIWKELSYGPLVSFAGAGVVTLPATTSTAVNTPASGMSAFWRMRVSYDRVTWGPYQLASTSAIDAGLVESTAMSPAAAYNQSNFGIVSSVASGSAAAVTVSGTGGEFTSYPALRGTTQANRPSATIVGVQPQSQQFVGWDGTTFQLKPTLGGVLADNLEPVGAVSVVGTAIPTLPTIVPIVVVGFIIGYAVPDGGAGASEPYVLTINPAGVGAAGATTGEQTIVGGVLISVAPGNSGNGHYTAGTSVTASGGTGGGTQGGGTATGGNGARMSNV